MKKTFIISYQKNRHNKGVSTRKDERGSCQPLGTFRNRPLQS